MMTCKIDNHLKISNNFFISYQSVLIKTSINMLSLFSTNLSRLQYHDLLLEAEESNFYYSLNSNKTFDSEHLHVSFSIISIVQPSEIYEISNFIKFSDRKVIPIPLKNIRRM